MKFWHVAAVVLTVAGCSGNPLNNGGPNPDGTTNTTVDLGGSTQVSSKTAIIHYEKQDTNGDGYASNFAYDSTNDTFTIDGLAFDGSNVYTRIPSNSSQLPTEYAGVTGYPGTFNVYESPTYTSDPVTGAPVSQFQYRAIYGKGATTSFVIVRTGSYVNYGFGGFVYSRDGGVTLPASGQAHYAGNYAGLRDFDGKTGLNYTTGQMTMDVDFAGFASSDNATGAGVKGYIVNRKIYASDGSDITSQVLADLNTKYNTTQSVLPTLSFTVNPSAMSPAGEMSADISSSINTSSGIQSYETGKYYAVISGANAGEVAGVIVVTSSDPSASAVTARETGGFILQRQ